LRWFGPYRQAGRGAGWVRGLFRAVQRQLEGACFSL
jgi:hypothetical protein